MSTHTDDDCGDESHDSENGVAGWVLKKSLFECLVLVNSLSIETSCQGEQGVSVCSAFTPKPEGRPEEKRLTGRGALGVAADEAKRRMGVERRMAVRMAVRMAFMIVGWLVR